MSALLPFQPSDLVKTLLCGLLALVLPLAGMAQDSPPPNTPPADTAPDQAPPADADPGTAPQVPPATPPVQPPAQPPAQPVVQPAVPPPSITPPRIPIPAAGAARSNFNSRLSALTSVTNRPNMALPTTGALRRPGIAGRAPQAGAAAGVANPVTPAVPAVPAGSVAAPQLGAGGDTAQAEVSTNAITASIGSDGTQLFDLKLQEMEINQLLDFYQEVSGKTVLRPANLAAPKVTLKSAAKLSRKEAMEALDSILSLNQISMVPQGEKFIKALPNNQAQQSGAVFYDGDPNDLSEAGIYVQYIAKFEFLDPKDLEQLLKPFASPTGTMIIIPNTHNIVLRDFSKNVKRMLEVLRKVDVDTPHEYEPVVIPIKYALAADIAQVLSSLTAGGGGGTRGGWRGCGGGWRGGGWRRSGPGRPAARAAAWPGGHRSSRPAGHGW